MNEFLARTTRRNAINLKWLPLDFRCKVPFTETCLASSPAQKIITFSRSITSQYCCPSPGMRERDAGCQWVQSVVSTLPVAGQGVACLPCCALLWVMESPELGKLSGASRADVRRCLTCRNEKEAEMSQASEATEKFFLRDPEAPGVRLCKTTGTIWQLAATKSECFMLLQKAGVCQTITRAHAKEGADNYRQRREINLAFGAATSSNFSGIFSLCGAYWNSKWHKMLLDWDMWGESRFA